MCGRFTLRVPISKVAKEYGLFSDFDTVPRYNIAPTQSVPVIRRGDSGSRICRLARWGLVPSWAKDTKLSASLINARAETVAEKPAFRAAFKRRRCLVPADGYYEWRTIGKKKQPYYVHRADDAVFAMAGLWECWRGDDGPPIESCTIITTEANEVARTVHDRMPVILAASTWDEWLAEDATVDELQGLLRPAAVDGFVVNAVSTLVNRAKNEVAECVVEVA